MEFDLNKALFSVRPSKEAFGIKAGDRENSADCFSAARGSATATIVISTALFAVEKLLNDSECVITTDSLVLLKTKETGTDVYLTFDGNTIKTTAGCSDTASIAAIIAWVTASSTDNEIKDLFAEIRSEMTMSGTVSRKLLCKFCDAFYYGFAKGHSAIDKQEEALTVSSAKMAFSHPSNAAHPIIGAKRNGENYDLDKSANSTDNADCDRFLQRCKNGEFVVAYDFGPELEKYILPLSSLDDFAPNETFVDIVSMSYEALLKNIEELETGSLDSMKAIGRLAQIILAGVPGTGKTRVLMAVAAALGMPFISVPVDASTEKDTFCGVTVVEDGKLSRKLTDFLLGVKNGAWIVVEEANLLDPNLEQGVFGQLIEAPYILTEYGYKTITRHPLCVISFTMNPDTIGTMPLNQAFTSRANAIYIMDNPEEADFIRNATAKFGDRWNHNQYAFAYGFMKKVQSFLKQKEISAEDIAQAVTPRMAMNFLKHCENGSVESALNKTFIGTIALYNREIAYQCLTVLKETASLKYPKE